MNEAINIYKEERPWGSFERFTDNYPSTVKIITVLANKKLSLQSHNKRSEFWKVIGGSGFFQIGENRYNVSIGDEYKVTQGEKHRMEALSDGLVVLEISTGDFDENDIVRYEDDFGRV